MLVFALSVPEGFAQQGLNLPFLKSVPQANYTNPAVISPHRFYLGFPLLSSMKIGMENTAFRYDDIIKKREDDSLYFDTKGMYDKLDEKNYLRMEFTTELFAMGFKIGRSFLSFNLSEKFYGDFMYPKEMISLMLYGNAQYIGQTVNAGGFDFQMNQYHEMAVGLAFPIGPKFSAGVRTKFLGGVANIDTKSTDILLFSPDEFSTELTTNIEVNTSIPGTDPKGDSLAIDVDGESFVSTAKTLHNLGLAFDFGMQFVPNEKFTLGFSMTDIGFIDWESGVRNFVVNNEKMPFTFDGIDLGKLVTDDTLSFDENLEQLGDSLEENVDIHVSHDPYRSFLIPKLYLSAIYHLTPRDHFGAQLRNDFMKGNLLPSLTLNYTREFGKVFALTGGYTLTQNLYSKIGLGMMIKAGPFQFYALTDNVTAMFKIKQARYVNTHFGMNFVISKPRERKPKVEEPIKTPIPELVK
jgi:hypothetical protein